MSASASRMRCPTCGRAEVRRVRRTVRTKIGNRELSVRRVEVEECARCGERLYDLAALARIRRARDGALRNDAA